MEIGWVEISPFGCAIVSFTGSGLNKCKEYVCQVAGLGTRPAFVGAMKREHSLASSLGKLLPVAMLFEEL